MTRVPFEYAVLRVVPRVERGEFINAGVVVYCREREFLAAAVHLDADRLHALDPSARADDIGAVLETYKATCNGWSDSPAAREQIGRRFRWLTAPRSTVVQPGPVHTGLTDDPAAETDRLFHALVR
ncbi:DUF3037 domain-containing protein [Jatrophihabitans fulvus]